LTLDGRDGLVTSLLFAARHHHLGTCERVALGDGATDAAATAGHDRYPAVETEQPLELASIHSSSLSSLLFSRGSLVGGIEPGYPLRSALRAHCILVAEAPGFEMGVREGLFS
jgi:hypothetical protein